MPSSLEKFQKLLRELFQFDCADLDFGIYRIMNHKRDVIERFISENLPNSVASELEMDALATHASIIDELNECRQRVVKALGANAVDADGHLKEEHHSIPLGKEYLELQAKASGAHGRDALEAAIFNHLYAFFSRYYQDGDFISKRRYSRHHRYAIPYNGEEVYFHWANSDQYFVKTGEHFQDYAFKSHGIAVNFKLRAVDVEQDNVQGDKRFFVPCADVISYDKTNRRLEVPFEFRPLNRQEEVSYGKTKQQERIIAGAVSEIPERLNHLPDALAALMATKSMNDDGESNSVLQHHLRQYTRRNTSDFFIHKDLEGFLARELDFYLKNEVLNLDEMEAAGEERSEGWFQTMRTIRSVGGQIIDFLDQIENLQKILWEKRKFVTETQYCITVKHVDEVFYEEIASCNAQWTEWRDLFGIDEDQIDLFNMGKNRISKRVEFLRSCPTLVLDTKYFKRDFVDRLLGSLDDLDGTTDGVLINGENWQAINLLKERYREQVKCIYIDPPYNTGQSEILYKNDYRDSCWLTMMESRLIAGKELLTKDGIQCTTIDDVEFHRLREVVARIFGEQNIAGIVVIKNNPSGRSTVKGLSIAHEYGIFCFASDDVNLGTIQRSERQLSQYPEEDEKGKFQWRNFLRSGGANDFRSARPRLHYPLIITGDRVRLPEIEWHSQTNKWKLIEKPLENEKVVWPVSNNGTEYTWRLGIESLKKNLEDIRVRRMKDGRVAIETKFRLDESGILPKTVWDEKQMNATAYGTTLLRNIMGKSQAFSFPKSVYATEQSLHVCSSDINGTILDYFAGSGTTAHAVINMNRDDSGRRKFILVEMAQYFESVLLPRIKKVTFAPEWKDGKPRCTATPQDVERSPRFVKYIRLESYEDALNNIDFDETSAQQTLPFHEYMLKYMLKWETRRSETLLNVEKLSKPFSYALNIHSDGQTRREIADIPETFNHLLGLVVKTRRVYDDDGRRYLVYRGQTDQRRVAVIWRETEGWQKADFERDRDFVAQQRLTEDADDVYVNGDSLIGEAKALEPLFKRRMFAGVAE